jgi:8-oxo-dGTP pyrophosphatase MutT (NUDIX family)
VDLEAALSRHLPADEDESRHLHRIREFVARHADPFDRRLVSGHLTGSAFVVDETGERVLLLHHGKLQRWLQPGGHADAGETSGEQVALREAREETGIEGMWLHPLAPRPLDVDVHVVPARRSEAEHQHLDLRYLVVAPAAALPTPGPGESVELRWFAWEEAAALDLDAGLRRGLAKARAFWPGTLGR